MRSHTAAAAYPASTLFKRNNALHRASNLRALREGDALYQACVATHRIDPARVTTLAALVAQGDASGELIDAGREPYVLREDFYNSGELATVAIYDTAAAGTGGDGRVDVELPSGTVRLPVDTLIYWR